MKIISTADQSHTIYLPELNEHYHSVNGAITESNYVYIKNGFDIVNQKNPVILEVGFGTGLNCLLTAIRAEALKLKTAYVTIEKFPLEKNITDKLNFGGLISPEAQLLFNKIHECNWTEANEITPYFSLKKIKADLLTLHFDSADKFDLIYFDAFGPDKQPEMWTPLIFDKISKVTAVHGIFVTYSAKGEVRRQLSARGFDMLRLPGPPGKNHMLRGIKTESNN